MEEYARYHGGGGGALELQFQALKQIPGTAGCFTVTLRVCGPLVPWAMRGRGWWDWHRPRS